MNTLPKIFAFCLMVTALLSTSGCLVDEDAPLRTIPRETDTLRTFTGGEFYVYDVRAQVTTGGNTQTVSGSLTVNYSMTTLSTPFVAGTIPQVLQEDSLLSLGGTNYSLRRYLQQNAFGAISVLAVEHNSTIYRAGNSISNPQAVEIIESPLPTVMTTGPTIAFDYMQGCEPVTSSCSAILAQSINKTLAYQGDTIANTLEGDFIAIRIDYSGSFTGGAAPTLFDLAGACDEDAAVYNGAEYIYPAVGIVRIEHSCIASSAGNGHSYTARLSNTNVAIP